MGGTQKWVTTISILKISCAQRRYATKQPSEDIRRQSTLKMVNCQIISKKKVPFEVFQLYI